MCIPDWDEGVVQMILQCCAAQTLNGSIQQLSDEAEAVSSCNEEIIIRRKKPQRQISIPVWRPSVSFDQDPFENEQSRASAPNNLTVKSIQQITDEYLASQNSIPNQKREDISRMERSVVKSFDRRVMDPQVETYLGDQRYWKNRKKDAPPPKRSKRTLCKTSHDDVIKVREQCCCKEHGTFGDQVSLDEHLDIRHMFHMKLTCVERQNYLTAVCFTKMHQEPPKMIVEGFSLCWNGVMFLLGVSTGCLSQAHNRMVWGINAVEHVPRKMKASPVTTMISSWIDHFVWRWTEKMPHKTFLHLPSSFTKTMIYHQCAVQCKYVNSKQVWTSPCCRMFLMVWCQNFGHVRIPRLNHFSKCNFCARWTLMRQNRRLSDLQQLALDKEKASKLYALVFIPDWDELFCWQSCLQASFGSSCTGLFVQKNSKPHPSLG